MPARVPRVALAGEKYRKSAKWGGRPPAANPHPPVKRPPESPGGGRPPKRRIEVAAQPDDRAGPGRTVERVTSRIAPQDLPSLIRSAARKGCIQPHETVTDKSLNVARGKTRTLNSVSLSSHTNIFSGRNDGRTACATSPVTNYPTSSKRHPPPSNPPIHTESPPEYAPASASSHIPAHYAHAPHKTRGPSLRAGYSSGRNPRQSADSPL